MKSRSQTMPISRVQTPFQDCHLMYNTSVVPISASYERFTFKFIIVYFEPIKILSLQDQKPLSKKSKKVLKLKRLAPFILRLLF